MTTTATPGECVRRRGGGRRQCRPAAPPSPRARPARGCCSSRRRLRTSAAATRSSPPGASGSPTPGWRIFGRTSWSTSPTRRRRPSTCRRTRSDQFLGDLMRLTEELSDPDLADVLIRRLPARPSSGCAATGVRWILMMARQSYHVGGKHRFWGGLNVEAVGGGPGLIQALYDGAERLGVDGELRDQGDGAAARRARRDPRHQPAAARTASSRSRRRAVVLASGGFEANPEWRTRYLGPGWELAHVRGTRHNTGDGIRIAIEIGAQPYGNWSGCHAVAWDAGSPPFGDRRVGDMFQKHSYPLGIIVNVRGERFVDEGADFRNYTYAKYGRDILQAAPAPRVPDLRPEGRADPPRGVPDPRGDQGRGGDDRGAGAAARDRSGEASSGPSKAFNAAVLPGTFNPRGARRQGHARHHPAQVELGAGARHAAVRRLRGHLRDHVHVRRPPRHAARLRFSTPRTGRFPGCFAAGELVGGLFYENYPGAPGSWPGPRSGGSRVSRRRPTWRGRADGRQGGRSWSSASRDGSRW